MGGDHATDGGNAFPSRVDSEDRGQSEVIGVILATSITVVLAAVIGQYVFGIDIIQSPEQSVGPQASFDTTVESDGDLRVRHMSGDRIDLDKVTVTGSEHGDFDDSVLDPVDDDGEWTASEPITLDSGNLTTGETVRITWQSSSTDDSTVLLEYEYNP
jgi:archaeal flagellin N-terminal-like domain